MSPRRFLITQTENLSKQIMDCTPLESLAVGRKYIFLCARGYAYSTEGNHFQMVQEAEIHSLKATFPHHS